MTLLSAREVRKAYGRGDALVRAVDDVDLDVGAGETAGAARGPLTPGGAQAGPGPAGAHRPGRPGQVPASSPDWKADRRWDAWYSSPAWSPATCGTARPRPGTPLVIGALTLVPSRIGARAPVSPVLQ